ncbi:hypothetical protein BpHYR1_030540 [Brachionus plicatilis]|uniref:Uncharacterized protein n=1 Tax=Brachionus plicatilis TaxID=10195 RepID=A0A3M7RZR6_BRAPC|nr:hypothetical protein BpHYR1_030540 [Brachionus plicatilis]
MQFNNLFKILALLSVLVVLFYSKNKQEIVSINLFQQSQSSLIHEWTSNGRVCQYSSIVSKHDSKTHIIETYFSL